MLTNPTTGKTYEQMTPNERAQMRSEPNGEELYQRMRAELNGESGPIGEPVGRRNVQTTAPVRFARRAPKAEAPKPKPAPSADEVPPDREGRARYARRLERSARQELEREQGTYRGRVERMGELLDQIHGSHLSVAASDGANVPPAPGSKAAMLELLSMTRPVQRRV